MGNIHRLGGIVVGVGLVMGLTTAMTSPDRLRQAMTELTEAGAAGVQVRVDDWVGTAGVRTLAGGQVPADGRFRIASVTKTFTAVAVLQLVDKGKVALDAPVAAYVPEYGVDPRITVRMLLQHTSGLYNYTDDLPLAGKDFEDNQFRTYRPAELIEAALAKPPRFEPGAGWSYSNTNYVLASQVVERVTGKPYDRWLRKHILEPLDLSDTYLPGTSPRIPGPHAHGYYGYPHEGKLRVLDTSRANPSWAGASGDMISTTKDLTTFIDALYAGELLSRPLLAEMREWEPTGRGGYGLGLREWQAECGTVYEGHTGGMNGYKAFLFRTETRTVAISVTVGAIDAQDPVADDRLDDAVDKVLNAAFC